MLLRPLCEYNKNNLSFREGVLYAILELVVWWSIWVCRVGQCSQASTICSPFLLHASRHSTDLLEIFVWTYLECFIQGIKE